MAEQTDNLAFFQDDSILTEEAFGLKIEEDGMWKSQETEDPEEYMKKFGNDEHIDKFVLIDNGNVAKHKELYPIFEEVFFYERFRKNKIVECNSVIPNGSKLMENNLDSALSEIEE